MNYKTLNAIKTFAERKGVTLQDIQGELTKPRQKTIINKQNSYFSIPLNEEIDPTLIENGSYGDIGSILELFDSYVDSNIKDRKLDYILNNFDFDLAKFNSDSNEIYFIEENDKYFLAENGNCRLAAYLLNFYVESAKAKTVKEKADVLKKYTFTAKVIHSVESANFINAFNNAVEKTSRNTNNQAERFTNTYGYSRGNKGNFYFYDKKSNLYTVSVGGYVFLNVPEYKAILLMKNIKKVPEGVSCFQSSDANRFFVTCRNQVFECKDSEEAQWLVGEIRGEAPDRFKKVENYCNIITYKDGSLSLFIENKSLNSAEYSEESLKKLTALREAILGGDDMEYYNKKYPTKTEVTIFGKLINDEYINIPARIFKNINYIELLDELEIFTKETKMIQGLEGSKSNDSER